MMKYIYFDILYTELWVTKFMSKIGIEINQVTNDTALNQHFSDAGFDSKLFIKNTGSSVFFLTVYICIWIIYSIIVLLSLISVSIKSTKEKLQRQLIWK